MAQSLRSMYGDRFMIVEAPDELVLLPVPDDPSEDLAELGRKLLRANLRQLRASVSARAKKEVQG